MSHGFSQVLKHFHCANACKANIRRQFFERSNRIISTRLQVIPAVKVDRDGLCPQRPQCIRHQSRTSAEVDHTQMIKVAPAQRSRDRLGILPGERGVGCSGSVALFEKIHPRRRVELIELTLARQTVSADQAAVRASPKAVAQPDARTGPPQKAQAGEFGRSTIGLFRHRAKRSKTAISKLNRDFVSVSGIFILSSLHDQSDTTVCQRDSSRRVLNSSGLSALPRSVLSNADIKFNRCRSDSVTAMRKSLRLMPRGAGPAAVQGPSGSSHTQSRFSRRDRRSQASRPLRDGRRCAHWDPSGRRAARA
jgi:hypothetical protein